MSQTLKTFEALFVPFADAVKKDKKQGGQTITFVDWPQYVMRAHREFPEGYSKAVTNVTSVTGMDKNGEEVSTMVLTVRITCNQTGAYQDACGAADAGKTSWGGAMAEAESQAFRRAMAQWGLGLEMYLDDDDYDFWTQGRDEDEEEDEEEEEEDPFTDPDESLPYLDEDPDEEDADKVLTERQEEVLRVIGQELAEHAEEHEDKGLEKFLNAMRKKLGGDDLITRAKAGTVIRKMRAKLKELDIEDPTEDGET